MKNGLRTASVALLALTTILAHADGPALSGLTGGSVFSSFDTTPMTVGWGFTVGSTAVNVLALGVWDDGGNGLAQDRLVGIWNADTGALVVSETVLMMDPIDGTDGFRYHTLASPFMLEADTRYNIGVSITSPFDNYKSSVTSWTVDPLITYTGTRRNASNGGFSNPTVTGTGNGRVGPNMNIAAVPEPGSMAAIGIGLAALAARRRRK